MQLSVGLIRSECNSVPAELKGIVAGERISREVFFSCVRKTPGELVESGRGQLLHNIFAVTGARRKLSKCVGIWKGRKCSA